MKEYRERAQISLRDLALQLNISASALGYIERDEREPGVRKAIKIAKAFGITVEDIWEETK